MNSKILWVLTVLIAATLSAAAQPAITIKDTLEFGNVTPDQTLNEQATIHGEVVVQNTGDSVLIISEVHPSCGCTTPKLDKDTLVPGEQTTMHVGLLLPPVNGDMHKTISFTTNDPLNHVRVLNIHVNVQRPVQLSSSFIPFNKGMVGDSILGSLEISVFGPDPVKVETLVYNTKLKLLSPAEKTLQPGERMEIMVAYVPEVPGAFSVQVLVKTSAKGYESFDLRGYGVVDPRPGK